MRINVTARKEVIFPVKFLFDKIKVCTFMFHGTCTCIRSKYRVTYRTYTRVYVKSYQDQTVCTWKGCRAGVSRFSCSISRDFPPRCAIRLRVRTSGVRWIWTNSNASRSLFVTRGHWSLVERGGKSDTHCRKRFLSSGANTRNFSDSGTHMERLLRRSEVAEL